MWNSFADEFCELARVFIRLPETERTGNYILGLESAFVSAWKKYRRIENVNACPIPPPRNKALLPSTCEVCDAELNFTFILGDNIGVVLVPERFDFQVKVSAFVVYPSTTVDLEDHWRVDTHMHRTGQPPNEPHALVHFQRGGHAQDKFSSHVNFLPGSNLVAPVYGNWNSLFQSPGPRIPCPPLCPILALDFAIGQHDGLVLNKLRNFPEYQNLVRTAQTRLWRPFFDGLSHHKNLKYWLGGMLLDGV